MWSLTYKSYNKSFFGFDSADCLLKVEFSAHIELFHSCYLDIQGCLVVYYLYLPIHLHLNVKKKKNEDKHYSCLSIMNTKHVDDIACCMV